MKETANGLEATLQSKHVWGKLDAYLLANELHIHQISAFVDYRR
jgi:hypothetical protein